MKYFKNVLPFGVSDAAIFLFISFGLSSLIASAVHCVEQNNNKPNERELHNEIEKYKKMSLLNLIRNKRSQNTVAEKNVEFKFKNEDDVIDDKISGGWGRSVAHTISKRSEYEPPSIPDVDPQNLTSEERTYVNKYEQYTQLKQYMESHRNKTSTPGKKEEAISSEEKFYKSKYEEYMAKMELDKKYSKDGVKQVYRLNENVLKSTAEKNALNSSSESGRMSRKEYKEYFNKMRLFNVIYDNPPRDRTTEIWKFGFSDEETEYSTINRVTRSSYPEYMMNKNTDATGIRQQKYYNQYDDAPPDISDSEYESYYDSKGDKKNENDEKKSNINGISKLQLNSNNENRNDPSTIEHNRYRNYYNVDNYITQFFNRDPKDAKKKKKEKQEKRKKKDKKEKTETKESSDKTNFAEYNPKSLRRVSRSIEDSIESSRGTYKKHIVQIANSERDGIIDKSQKQKQKKKGLKDKKKRKEDQKDFKIDLNDDNDIINPIISRADRLPYFPSVSDQRIRMKMNFGPVFINQDKVRLEAENNEYGHQNGKTKNADDTEYDVSYNNNRFHLTDTEIEKKEINNVEYNMDFISDNTDNMYITKYKTEIREREAESMRDNLFFNREDKIKGVDNLYDNDLTSLKRVARSSHYLEYTNNGNNNNKFRGKRDIHTDQLQMNRDNVRYDINYISGSSNDNNNNPNRIDMKKTKKKDKKKDHKKKIVGERYDIFFNTDKNYINGIQTNTNKDNEIDRSEYTFFSNDNNNINHINADEIEMKKKNIKDKKHKKNDNKDNEKNTNKDDEKERNKEDKKKSNKDGKKKDIDNLYDNDLISLSRVSRSSHYSEYTNNRNVNNKLRSKRDNHAYQIQMNKDNIRYDINYINDGVRDNYIIANRIDMKKKKDKKDKKKKIVAQGYDIFFNNDNNYINENTRNMKGNYEIGSREYTFFSNDNNNINHINADEIEMKKKNIKDKKHKKNDNKDNEKNTNKDDEKERNKEDKKKSNKDGKKKDIDNLYDNDLISLNRVSRSSHYSEYTNNRNVNNKLRSKRDNHAYQIQMNKDNIRYDINYINDGVRDNYIIANRIDMKKKKDKKDKKKKIVAQGYDIFFNNDNNYINENTRNMKGNYEIGSREYTFFSNDNNNINHINADEIEMKKKNIKDKKHKKNDNKDNEKNTNKDDEKERNKEDKKKSNKDGKKKDIDNLYDNDLTSLKRVARSSHYSGFTNNRNINNDLRTKHYINTDQTHVNNDNVHYDINYISNGVNDNCIITNEIDMKKKKDKKNKKKKIVGQWYDIFFNSNHNYMRENPTNIDENTEIESNEHIYFIRDNNNINHINDDEIEMKKKNIKDKKHKKNDNNDNEKNTNKDDEKKNNKSDKKESNKEEKKNDKKKGIDNLYDNDLTSLKRVARSSHYSEYTYNGNVNNKLRSKRDNHAYQIRMNKDILQMNKDNIRYAVNYISNSVNDNYINSNGIVMKKKKDKKDKKKKIVGQGYDIFFNNDNNYIDENTRNMKANYEIDSSEYTFFSNDNNNINHINADEIEMKKKNIKDKKHKKNGDNEKNTDKDDEKNNNKGDKKGNNKEDKKKNNKDNKKRDIDNLYDNDLTSLKRVARSSLYSEYTTNKNIDHKVRSKDDNTDQIQVNKDNVRYDIKYISDIVNDNYNNKNIESSKYDTFFSSDNDHLRITTTGMEDHDRINRMEYIYRNEDGENVNDIKSNEIWMKTKKERKKNKRDSNQNDQKFKKKVIDNDYENDLPSLKRVARSSDYLEHINGSTHIDKQWSNIYIDMNQQEMTKNDTEYINAEDIIDADAMKTRKAEYKNVRKDDNTIVTAIPNCNSIIENRNHLVDNNENNYKSNNDDNNNMNDFSTDTFIPNNYNVPNSYDDDDNYQYLKNDRNEYLNDEEFTSEFKNYNFNTEKDDKFTRKPQYYNSSDLTNGENLVRKEDDHLQRRNKYRGLGRNFVNRVTTQHNYQQNDGNDNLYNRFRPQHEEVHHTHENYNSYSGNHENYNSYSSNHVNYNSFPSNHENYNSYSSNRENYSSFASNHENYNSYLSNNENYNSYSSNHKNDGYNNFRYSPHKSRYHNNPKKYYRRYSRFGKSVIPYIPPIYDQQNRNNNEQFAQTDHAVDHKIRHFKFAYNKQSPYYRFTSNNETDKLNSQYTEHEYDGFYNKISNSNSSSEENISFTEDPQKYYLSTVKNDKLVNDTGGTTNLSYKKFIENEYASVFNESGPLSYEY